MRPQDKARSLRPFIEKAAVSLDDSDALNAVELFKPWKSDTAYDIGDRVRHEDVLYKCVQAHTSQSDWTPDITPALWTRVTVEEWPEWVQPTGAQDAYMSGDRVTYEGQHWVCTMDYNTYAPGVYGWEVAE